MAVLTFKECAPDPRLAFHGNIPGLPSKKLETKRYPVGIAGQMSFEVKPPQLPSKATAIGSSKPSLRGQNEEPVVYHILNFCRLLEKHSRLPAS